MPRYKNQFAAPKFSQETIIDGSTGETIGTIRVKPSSVLWKPKGQQRYYAVSLDAFTAWITAGATRAGRTKS